MMSLFWSRIIAPKPEKNIVETETQNDCANKRIELWQKIDETVLENIDDFTELFARQATPKKQKEVTKLQRKKIIKVLENKRSQSVGIFAQSLNRLRIDPPAIERAIYNWDTSTISLDLLQQMLDHKANAEELNMIKEAIAKQSDLPLDGPEKFLLRFSEISCATERIACIIFRTEFEESSIQIEQKIETVHKLCVFLMENDYLKQLFSIILTLGNFMNGGNRYRGQADGFGLDVLNKLRDVKSKDKKSNLLHFIVKTYIHKRRQQGLKIKEIIYPVPDANDVKDASSIDFIVLNEQIESLGKKLAGKFKIIYR